MDKLVELAEKRGKEIKELQAKVQELEAELNIFRTAFPKGAKIIQEAREKGFDRIRVKPEAGQEDNDNG